MTELQFVLNSTNFRENVSKGLVLKCSILFVRHPYSEIIILPLAFCSVAIITRDQMRICDDGGWWDVRWKKTLNRTRTAREESLQDACASPLHPHEIPVASSFRRRHRCRDVQVADECSFRIVSYVVSSVREPRFNFFTKTYYFSDLRAPSSANFKEERV